ncbi:MAG TPA: hypothetical protein VIJ56_10410 [Acidimicrobiales bacterium]
MPSSPVAGDSGGDDAPRMTFWQRVKYSMVRPDDDPKEVKEVEIRPADEIEADIRRSNDKERAIGLVAAPVAAFIGLLIGNASVNYAKTHNLSTSVYDKLTYVLLGLAVLVLLSSWLRKRMFQGITLALYGLAIFQLHYTYFGFAAPFLLAGAWYLIRAWRLQQELKKAEAAGPQAPRPKGATTNAAAPRPRRNKRYTPPS